MRSIASSGSSATPIANTMTTNLINSYQSATILNLSNSNDWESLRKQARQLENEIDSKLVGFSKLCSNFSVSSYAAKSTSSQPSTPTSASAPSSSSSSSDLLFITLSNEIEDALKKLTALNNKMSDCLNENMSNSSANGVVHTLQRHRDILRDYSHEYEKTKRNIMSYKEREKLLATSSFRTTNETNLNNRRSDSASNGSNSTSLYMKEYDHLKNSHAMIDQQLEIAELTKENLQSQRQGLRLIQQRMNTLAHKFPLLNNLVQKIKFKKRKDSIVLATVISICLILMLLYIF